MAEQWKLYYWGPDIVGPGRAEFVRVMFEELGIKFKEVNKGIPQMVLPGNPQGYPARAVPIIKKGDFQLSQAPVICMYLGKKYGLFPDNEEDEFHAAQVNATIHDYIAEGRLSFHAKDFTASYFTQEEETKPNIEKFKAERVPNYLRHFEATLNANNGGSGFLFGKKLTYVDLALLHVLRATESQFPEAWKDLESIPLLKAFKERISARPNLADYFKSDRCRPFEGNSMM